MIAVREALVANGQRTDGIAQLLNQGGTAHTSLGGMRHGLCRLMPWSTPTGTSRARSDLVGSIYLAWGTPHSDLATITQLGIE